MSDDAIRDQIDEYKDSKKLKPISGGSEEKLSTQKATELEFHFKTHTYLYVKDIIAHEKITYDIEYSIAGMRNLLHKHGFSYKKPSIVPGKANQQLQKNWIAEYEKLKQNLLDDETICFMDGVHPTHNVQTACGWIKKGERKELLGNTGRSRVNLSGVIDVFAHKVIIQEDKILNADSIISFLKKIEEAYPQKTKIYLFCDNAPYYRNKSVLEHLETSKITLKFLPPYSPNLNPIERLWKWMKERIIYNTYKDQVATHHN